MSYIYKIINLKNSKIYIGKTNSSIEHRFIEHCKDSKKNSTENRPLYKAMNKYGIENFKIELVEQCELEKASEREKYWIEYFGSFKYGYNATLGGDGKPYLDYDLIYKTYQEVKNISKTANIVGCSVDSVALIIKNKGVDAEEIKSNMALLKSNSVAMINKETNEIIKVFNGTHEAGRFLGKGHQHIQAVCKGKRKSAYGFYWKYI